jgi:hypothetical protein
VGMQYYCPGASVIIHWLNHRHSCFHTYTQPTAT